MNTSLEDNNFGGHLVSMFFQSYDEDVRRAELPQAPGYIAGNQIVLGQQGIDSALLSVSLQTASLEAEVLEPKALESIYFSSGIQGNSGPAAWYEIDLGNGNTICLTDPIIRHSTGYEENILPKTIMEVEGVKLEVFSIAPVKKDKDEVKRYPGLVYAVLIRNETLHLLSGKVRIHIKGTTYLVKGGKDAWWINHPESPEWSAETNAWCFSPQNGIGLKVTGGEGAIPDSTVYPGLEWELNLKPGEAQVFSTKFEFQNIAHNDQTSLISPNSLKELKEETLSYWKELTGNLAATWAKRFPLFLDRSVQEAMFCIRLDLKGNVIGISPSPVPEEEFPILSDILWICMPVLYLQPQLYKKAIEWLLHYLNKNKTETFLDTRTRVIPAIMMGLGYRTTGQKDLFVEDVDLAQEVDGLLESLEKLGSDHPGLYPTELIRRHKPLMAFELGTNILCWAAFRLWSEVYLAKGNKRMAAKYNRASKRTHQAIQQGFIVHGPGVSGYLLAGIKHPTNRLGPCLYYEEDALEIAIAPFMGFCDGATQVWKDTLNYMFSSAYDLVHNIPDTLLWWELWNFNGLERQEKFSDPSILARLVSIDDSDVEFDRALIQFDQEIDNNGAIWEKTQDGKRLMRSGRLAGAAYLIFFNHILGIQLDGSKKVISFKPHNTWRTIDFTFGENTAVPFEIQYRSGQEQAIVRLRNKAKTAWKFETGFWFPADLSVKEIDLNGQPFPKKHLVEPAGKWQDVQAGAEVNGNDMIEFRIELERQSLVYQAFLPKI